MPHTTDTDAALFEQLRPRLEAISRRIVGSAAEAQDVVQDCFLKWHAADTVALATPAAWLTTVVQHHSVDRLRQRGREAQLAQDAADLGPEVQAACAEDGFLRRAALAEALGRMQARLTPAERLALVLREVFDCDHADIAAALGAKEAAARQYLARARRRLRQSADPAPPQERLCRELVLRFQAAINGMDLPAVMSLLAHEQPASVGASPQATVQRGPCANDAAYALAA